MLATRKGFRIRNADFIFDGIEMRRGLDFFKMNVAILKFLTKQMSNIKLKYPLNFTRILLPP